MSVGSILDILDSSKEDYDSNNYKERDRDLFFIKENAIRKVPTFSDRSSEEFVVEFRDVIASLSDTFIVFFVVDMAIVLILYVIISVLIRYIIHRGMLILSGFKYLDAVDVEGFIK